MQAESSHSPNPVGESVAALTLIVSMLISDLTKSKTVNAGDLKRNLEELTKEINNLAKHPNSAALKVVEAARISIHE